MTSLLFPSDPALNQPTEPQRQYAGRDGWSRCWRGGQPHYFVKGAHAALCGSPAGLLHGNPDTDYPLNIQDEPDQDVDDHNKKSACPHCQKKVRLMEKAARR